MNMEQNLEQNLQAPMVNAGVVNTMTAPVVDQRLIKGPKALFWYLTLFFSLSITAFAIGGLWFQFINKFLPKAINNSYSMSFDRISQTAVKMEIASLIIAVPVFFLLSFFIRKALAAGYLAVESKIRLWISYIILFFVVAIAVGDLIAILFSFLDGDFTNRFLLKAFAILFIVAWIFSYYFLELKSHVALVGSNLPKIIGILSLVIIVISIIGSFFIIDSPMQTRKKAFDQKRVNNISSIKSSVQSYYTQKGSLPASLADLQANYGYGQINDPETGLPLEYKIINATSYKLCADFDTNSEDQVNNGYSYDYYGNNSLNHPSGHYCFDVTVSVPANKQLNNLDTNTVNLGTRQ